MKVIAVVLALVAAASAGVIAPVGVAVAAPTIISRAPAHDSAVIKSDRLGGNFAYSVSEAHAYAAQTPIVQHVTSPVAVSYSAGAPIVTSYAAAAPVAVAAPVTYAAAAPVAYAAAPAVVRAAPAVVAAPNVVRVL